MTQVLITVDTELSAALWQQGADSVTNYERSIVGAIEGETAGIGWQMDVMDKHGLTGVFFVDPMPALVYGHDVIARVVDTIVSRGHDVQLHLHPEWLAWAKEQPVGARRGRSIGDFSYDDQMILIARARQLLIDAGAPPPIAFRAGNFGANDDTLRALGALGFAWDSSFNPTCIGDPCAIGLGADQIDPVARLGITEVPVSAINDRPGHLRHTQVCALSWREMRAALDHAALTQRPVFTVVTHSFEMLSRDRQRANPVVMRRFEALCKKVGEHPGLWSTGFAQLAISPATTAPERLQPSFARTAMRHAEQAFATLAYEQ